MSSKRAHRRRSCTGKVRYPDFPGANAAMHRLLRLKGSDGWLQVYRCRFCCGYHFGHAPRRDMPARRLHALMERL